MLGKSRVGLVLDLLAAIVICAGFGLGWQLAPATSAHCAVIGEHAQRVQLAHRLDDPRQNQVPEHLTASGGPQHLMSTGQATGQAAHPRRGNRQRPARSPRARTQTQLTLAGRHPLPRDRLSSSSSASSCAQPMCSISRDAR